MVNFDTLLDFCSLNRMITVPIIIFLLLSSNCLSPKSTELTPDKQPYQLQMDQNLEGEKILLSDLDNNGFTEILTIYSSLSEDQPGSRILLMTFEGKIIEQINYPGKIIDSIYPLNYDDDENLEILVPFLRNDSLFVSFVNMRGKKLFYFFLIDGKPRLEEGGIFKWDPQIRGFYILDLNNDGIKELVTVITTGYARLPRGILVHSLPHGELIGKAIIGSPPRDNFLDDFDGDGKAEILCFGTAPNNGAEAGGFTDQKSYLIMYDLVPVPQVVNFKEICKKFSNYYLLYEDFDGDSHKELLAWTEAASEQFVKSKIVQLDPLTFNEIKQRTFNTPIYSAIAANLNRDAPREIVVIQSQNEILVLNHQLDKQEHRIFPSNIYNVKKLPDIDNDGIDEIVVVGAEGDFWLDTKLRTKAYFPDMRCEGIIRRGENLSPQIVVLNKNRYQLGLLVQNKFYLVKRYYPTVCYLLLVVLSFVVAKFTIDLRRRNQLLKSIQLLAIDSDVRGFMLIGQNGKIYMINRTLRMLLGILEDKKYQNSHLSDTLSRQPDIFSFIKDTFSRPPRRYEKMVTIKRNERQIKFQLFMEPVFIKTKKKPFWLLTLVDKSTDDEILQAKTWCKMAQKAAHDIKNPLSSITLTLQRLQMLNQERSPQMTEKFDLYVARVIERIESLKRISKNFMKFVNIESLNFVNTDLNQFLVETTHVIRAGLPPDIQLQFKPGDNLPMIKIDQDAIRSIIENLVSNAINAMPEGGIITISTQFLHGLSFPDRASLEKDFILIEVSDTGTGIPQGDLSHLFEPDFTKTEGGNGLGLAYVKKTVDDHCGYIEIESEPEAGTTFSIYLPMM